MQSDEETETYEDNLEARAENPTLMEDAISAMVNLGYQRLEAYKVINKVMADNRCLRYF